MVPDFGYTLRLPPLKSYSYNSLPDFRVHPVGPENHNNKTPEKKHILAPAGLLANKSEWLRIAALRTYAPKPAEHGPAGRPHRLFAPLYHLLYSSSDSSYLALVIGRADHIYN